MRQMVDSLNSFLEESWLFLFLISILFIFFILVRDLGNQTRKLRDWRRSSYQKVLPRVMLTFQHYTRRGELLSVTNYGMCQNVKHDMVNYLKFKFGYSDDDIESLLKNRKELEQIFPDKNVVMFLLDVNQWLNLITPKLSFFERIAAPFKKFFKEERDIDREFFIELALVIRNFRKAIE